MRRAGGGAGRLELKKKELVPRRRRVAVETLEPAGDGAGGGAWPVSRIRIRISVSDGRGWQRRRRDSAGASWQHGGGGATPVHVQPMTVETGEPSAWLPLWSHLGLYPYTNMDP
jgi:hypothetical protein